MGRIVYVNGRYLPYAEAAVHVEDRGFQFGDAVYEVCPVLGGRLIDETRHLARLGRSLSEIGIAPPLAGKALGQVMRETVRRNRVRDGMVYLQVSRGVAPRDFLFPAPEVPRTVVCIARGFPAERGEALARQGVKVRTMPDQRWGRPDIKSVQLLAPVLAKEAARAAGAREAWLIDREGRVTEGASSNAWIIDAAGQLITRQADLSILAGITRSVVKDVCAREGLVLVERPFTLAEARAAREAFLTSATNFVMPVVAIDDTPVGEGRPGRITLRLRGEFMTAAEVAPLH